MAENRRNHYRILQVQPEAPPEVIKASWRALMHATRAHPDLGGDPRAAALINEAYAVLSDPDRRRAYDARLAADRSRAGARPGAGAGGGPAGRAEPPRTAGGGPAADPRPRPGAAPRFDPACWLADRCCPLCRAALPGALRPDSRCVRCDAPLAPATGVRAGERELFGRRGSTRRARGDAATLRGEPGGAGAAARLVDLSVGGAALASAAPFPGGTALRVTTATLDAVARVVACHAVGGHWRLRVQWLTARPLAAAGVFLRATA
jgi:curved DNA-binding protein CbpA